VTAPRYPQSIAPDSESSSELSPADTSLIEGFELLVLLALISIGCWCRIRRVVERLRL
jgi:hypothetical protein